MAQLQPVAMLWISIGLGFLAGILVILKYFLGRECYDDNPCLPFGAFCDLTTNTCNTTSVVPRPLGWAISTLVVSTVSCFCWLSYCCIGFFNYKKQLWTQKRIQEVEKEMEEYRKKGERIPEKLKKRLEQYQRGVIVVPDLTETLLFDKIKA